MIFDVLANSHRYDSVHPLFAACFAYLKTTDLAALPVGRQPLGTSGVTVIVGEAPPKTKEIARLEGHQKFIDIQYMVAGEELIGYVPRGRCTEKSNDEAKDFQELAGTAEYLTLRPGCFGIYFPEDAHHPGIGTGAHTGPIRKIVFKIPVQTTR